MKLLPILPLLLAAPLLMVTPVRAGQTVQEILTQAQTEYLRGDMDAAKRDFAAIVEHDPKNQVASNYLRMIQVAEQADGGGKALEKDLAGIIIPKIEYHDASLDSVLDSLKKTVAKATNDKKSVNFVSQIPNEQLQAQSVTLSLTNVPFGEVLHYIGSVANVRFVFDKYAVVVKPLGGSTTASAPGAK